LETDHLNSWSHGKVTKKLERWSDQVITAIGPNERLKGDLIVLFITIVDARVQYLVIFFKGTLDRLANNGILSRIHTAGEISLVSRKRVRVDPALKI
jgi:hypothetical protein